MFHYIQNSRTLPSSGSYYRYLPMRYTYEVVKTARFLYFYILIFLIRHKVDFLIFSRFSFSCAKTLCRINYRASTSALGECRSVCQRGGARAYRLVTRRDLEIHALRVYTPFSTVYI